MARTGETTLKVYNNGVFLGGFSGIDLGTGLSGTDEGGGIAGLTGSGGGSGANIATEVLAATASGSNITLDLTGLSHTFKSVEVVFRNGQAITPVTYWSISGSTVTVFNADPSESFMVQYTY